MKEIEDKRKKKSEAGAHFDGHLEQDITRMNPKEKLLYLSRQIRLHHFIKNRVRKVSD